MVLLGKGITTGEVGYVGVCMALLRGSFLAAGGHNQ